MAGGISKIPDTNALHLLPGFQFCLDCLVRNNLCESKILVWSARSSPRSIGSNIEKYTVRQSPTRGKLKRGGKRLDVGIHEVYFDLRDPIAT
jgi:hypothetical protein